MDGLAADVERGDPGRARRSRAAWTVFQERYSSSVDLPVPARPVTKMWSRVVLDRREHRRLLGRQLGAATTSTLYVTIRAMRRAAALVRRIRSSPSLAGGGTVVGLNATVFGPGDFVRVYLDALARGDAESALALPGVDAERRRRPRCSHDASLGGLTDIRQLSRRRPRRRRSTASPWPGRLPAASGTTSSRSNGSARDSASSRSGASPSARVAVLTLDVQHDPRFTVNGVAESTNRDRGRRGRLRRPGPGLVRVRARHHVPARRRRSRCSPTGRARSWMRRSTSHAGAGVRDRSRPTRCAGTSTTAPPSRCCSRPAARSARRSRTASSPTRCGRSSPSRSSTIAPGHAFGTWVAGPAPGTAHLVVEVKSLFDGSVSHLR